MTVIHDTPNAVHETSPSDASWSSVNLAEAVPGVMTPLCWSLWGPASEVGIRQPFYTMGALTRAELAVPASDQDRVVKAFFGRQALRVDFICRLGDLIPGQSGDGLARDVFGFVPDSYVARPSLRRLPFIVGRYPAAFLRIPARARALRADTERWWIRETARSSTLDLAGAQAQLAGAVEQFKTTLGSQATVVACAIQPLYEGLSKLAASVGVDGSVLMQGQGSHEETAGIEDLWKVSRGRLTMTQFLARHGYQGAAAGEVSSRVWREDPAPVLRLLEGYTGLDESADPALAELSRAAQREAAEAALLSALTGAKRVAARVLLRLAATYLPLRGVSKVSYLMSIDVARAAARRIGALLVADGVLGEVEDVFFLTAPELLGALPADPAAVVLERRALRTRYEGLDVPSVFTGQPVATAAVTSDESLVLQGVGTSPGVVEGRAVVVSDPTDADIRMDDILIAHTTDPAWASAMFLSSALVVDIGGMLSHAAVVAREIGVPCVMNTRTGTKAIRTGDRLRVDGTTGTVEILSRT